MSPNYSNHPHASLTDAPVETPLSWCSLILRSIDIVAQGLSLPSWTLTGIFVVLTILIALFAFSSMRLRHIPGPRWAPYSRLWLMRVLTSGNTIADLEEVNRKYGRHPGNAQNRRGKCYHISTLAKNLLVKLPYSLPS